VSVQALSPADAQQLEAAIRLLRGGQAPRALAIARALAARLPRAPDAQQLLALCLADAGDLDEAELAFQRALEHAPGQPVLLANHGALLRRLGRRDQAVQVLQRAVAAAPTLANGWFDLGLAALELGRHAEARTALERLVALRPDDARGWHALGNALRAGNDLAGAEAAFRRSVTLAPGNAAGWVNLGAVLRMTGRPLEALACFDSAAQAGFRGPELADARAGALIDVGRLDEALHEVRRTAVEHPDFAAAQLTLAHLLWEYGDGLAPGEDPFATFRATAARLPAQHPLQVALVGLLLEAQQAEEALQRVQRIREHADRPELVALEAEAHERLGQPARASRCFEQAQAGLADSPAFLNSHARHLLRAGHCEAAERQALAAIRLDADNQQAWAYLATAWRLRDDAREHWLCDYERLVTMVDVEPPPGHADAASFLAALRATLEPLHKARRQPLHQSLRGGSQTPGRLFGRPDPVLDATRQALARAIEGQLSRLPADPGHPFLRRATRRVRFVGSWSVKLWSAGSHANHIHPEGWMSSAFYVALPASVQDPGNASQAGWIHFGQPPVELGLQLPARRCLRPAPGRLALFPSYLWHGTVPFEDTEPRITIAFDMLPAP
jgi:tetratricopeptide (TPR) repeat protein